MKFEKLLALFFCSFIFFTASAQNTKEYFIPYQQQGKWGYADTLGNIRLSPNYDMTNLSPASYSSNRFIVSENNKYGVVNNQNKVIIPFEFNDIYLKYSEDYKIQLFITIKNEKYGLYDAKGEQLLETKNDGITIFNSKYSSQLSDYSDQLYFIVDRGEKSGVYSYSVSTHEFKELIPIMYSKERIYDFNFKEEYAFNDNKNYYVLSKDGFTEITTEEYEKSIKPLIGIGNEERDGSRSDGNDTFYKFELKNNQIFKLSLKKGKWDRDNQQYRMDTIEKVPLTIKFKQAILLNINVRHWHDVPENFRNIKNVLLVSNGKKQAVVSPSQTEQLIQYSYTQIDTTFTREIFSANYPLIKAYKDKKWGLVNANDLPEIPFNYDDIAFFSPSYKALENNSSGKITYYGFIVKDKSNYYVLDKNQNYLQNYPFDDYRYFQKDEQKRDGFYIFNGDKKGIAYQMYLGDINNIFLFKPNYPKKYRLEIVDEWGYRLPFALIKVYDENDKLLGYADVKGTNYWK